MKSRQLHLLAFLNPVLLGRLQSLSRLMMGLGIFCHISRGMQVRRFNSLLISLTVCQDTKARLEEIYRLRHRENLADAVRGNNFTIEDEDGNVILPSCWEQVVRPSARLQIILPSDILNPDIASRYSRTDEPTSRYRQRSPPVVLPDSDAESAELLEVVASISNSSDTTSGDDEESEIDSDSSESDGADSKAQEEVGDEILREVNIPNDGDGNSLVFQVNTKFLGPQRHASTNAQTNHQSTQRDTQTLAGNLEHLNIAKAISAQSDGRTSLQIHVLPGPRTHPTDPGVSIQWFHLHCERLDFRHFKETCLGISGISERLRGLVRHLFDKVEKEKLKVFLDGMFIEPGTVLRADESHQKDPQSAIFSCIPYFDLQVPTKKTPATANHFSSRTLMQSYYPYEPVQDRDAEQAYRVFGNEQRNALIHVPNMWMVNIGPDVVATCAHEALSKSFVQSIEIIKTDLLQRKDEKTLVATIRLRDWDHRKLLYNLDECRSFFQMEQRLKELRWSTSQAGSDRSLQLLWHTSNDTVRVAPGLWSGIVRQKDTIFIDLSLSNDGTAEDENSTDLHVSSNHALPSIPFFHWPQLLDKEKDRTATFLPDEVKRSMQCLESVEKDMLSEVLSNNSLYSPVEKTFTTTAYYRSLREETAEYVKTGLPSLLAATKKSGNPTPDLSTVHKTLVHRQRNAIAEQTLKLCDVMQRSLELFVSPVDKSTMLRKVWGAMKSISSIASITCRRSSVEDDATIDYKTRSSQGWFVRPDINNSDTPASFRKLKRTFERCKKCSSNEMYGTSKAALSHLHKHLRSLDSALSDHIPSEEWIASYSQKEFEMWNEGTARTLKMACKIAQKLFIQAEELSEGVRNDDGQISALFTFPRPLLSAFRQLLVFYFVIERSVFFIEEARSDRRMLLEAPEYMATLPFSTEGLQVIETFGRGVQQALALAREELCAMVKSKEPVGVYKRLSLTPEYVCGWLMRRLLVKPLDKRMTVSDMYREYLSTVVSFGYHPPYP